MSDETIQALNTTAIILASLSGLWGVYFVLFVLAIWSTHRQGTASSRRLRYVTIVLFLDLLIHLIARSLQFARARLQRDTKEELLTWTIPLVVIGNVTTTISGLLSDGTLAWRFYIIYDRARWAFFLPAAMVIINALFCWSADFQHLAIYSRPEFYENRLLPITMDIAVAWGWSMFTANSLMTGGIIYKIMWSYNAVQGIREPINSASSRYATALRAIIESAVVTWIGILLCEIGMLGPSKGHVTTNENLGDIVLSIIPIFFGISQSLITARLGLVRETRGTNEYTMSQSQQSDRNPRPRPPTFNVITHVTTHTDYEETKVDAEEDKTPPDQIA